MSSSIEIRVLGPLEVVADGRSVTPKAHKQRALLANLVVGSGEVASDDRLIDDLWAGKPPPSALHALRVYVSQLRKLLPEGVLATHVPGYRLEVQSDAVDVVRFERLLAQGQDELAGGDAERAAETLREALALWRGEPYADFGYEPWAQREIARLQELRQQALELRLEAELALGRTDVIAELEALAAANPLRERVHALLMRALYRAGRQSDALAHFQAARTTLVEELGLEPGPELRALQAAILRHDEDLLAVVPPARPQRKLATVLVAALSDAASLEATLDPEAYAALLRRWLDCTSGAVSRHGGTIDKLSREVVTAVFGVPTAHEDDALRAARAACELRESAAAIDVSTHVGVASGEILAGGDRLATGAAAVVAARLQAEAEEGWVLVDDATRRLTVEAAQYEPLDGPADVFRLHAVSQVAAAIPRRLDVPLVGRTEELAALNALAARSEVERQTLVAVVHGPPGIGKTRVARELVRTMRGTVRECRCLPYGERSGYAALRQLVGERPSVDDAVADADEAAVIAERLAPVWGDEGTAEDVPWGFRRVCEALAARAPLVLVLDDLHWGDPVLLDAVEHLVARAEGPIFVLCVARDELLETRPTLATNVVALEPLGDQEIDELAQHLNADALALPDKSRARFVAAAEGNPLFLEQLIAHATETGSLEPPPTLRALLAARLDRLGPGERAVLERAAVIGRDGALAELAELLEPGAAAGLTEHTRVLERRGLFSPAGAGRFHFHHGLVEEVGYRSIPKELRADLHERYADLLAARDADDELVGLHLERAHQLLAELGRDDRRVQRLAQDAAARLGRAADRVLRRNDVRDAIGFVRRAIDLVGDDHVDRNLLCEYGVALSVAGATDESVRALLRTAELAREARDRTSELRAEVELAVRGLVTGEATAADVLQTTSDAVQELEHVGENRALGRVWLLTAWVRGGIQGHNALRAEAAERALRYYNRAAWPAAACISQVAAAAYFGPMPVPIAIERCEQLLADASDLAVEATVRAYLAGLTAMAGRFDAAHALIGEARTRFDELDQTVPIWSVCSPIHASLFQLAGRPVEADVVLRESCEELIRSSEFAPLATQAADLAALLLELDRNEEAEQWARIAEEHSGPDDSDAQSAWRSASAKLLAANGAFSDAERLAREAVAIADRTDCLNRRASAYVTVADVLRLHGQDVEADLHLDAAANLLAAKGNIAAAASVAGMRGVATT